MTVVSPQGALPMSQDEARAVWAPSWVPRVCGLRPSSVWGGRAEQGGQGQREASALQPAGLEVTAGAPSGSAG